jgi:hypothetical protein
MSDTAYTLIEVRAIRHDKQRYPTWGDWAWDDESAINFPRLTVTMSKLSDWRYLYLGAIHEIVEAMLLKAAGITQAQVDAFDIDYEKRRVAGEKTAACGCPITQDPGSDIHAPYRTEHMLATQIEYGLAAVMVVDAATYDNACAEETEPWEK